MLLLQAMSVMKRGMPPGGMNPVPVKVAVKDKPASPARQQHMQPAASQPVVAELNRVQGVRAHHCIYTHACLIN